MFDLDQSHNQEEYTNIHFSLTRPALCPLRTSSGLHISCIDALAGAGKTRHLVSQAARLADNGEKVLFVQPTTDLIEATLLDLKQHVPSVQARPFHAKTPEGNPISGLQTHLNRTGAGGEIVLTTHETWTRLGHFPVKQNWNALIDEVPEVIVFHNYDLPDEHRVSLRPTLTE